MESIEEFSRKYEIPDYLVAQIDFLHEAADKLMQPYLSSIARDMRTTHIEMEYYRKQFNRTLDESVRHGDAMMGNILKLALSGAIKQPTQAARE